MAKPTIQKTQRTFVENQRKRKFAVLINCGNLCVGSHIMTAFTIQSSNQTMRILLILSTFLLSCNSNSNSQVSKIEYIDSIVNDYHMLIHRVVTDTTYLKADTIYTNYEYDKSAKLLSIYIEETATNNQYISYVSNDSLIKIVVQNRNPNYLSDDAAVYYIDNGIVIKKEETRDKLEDIQKFISDQKRNIQFFKDTLGTHL